MSILKGVNGGFSWKRLGFVLATLVGYTVPTILLVIGSIKGPEWLNFYQIIIPSTLGVYAAGKWVDMGSKP